MKCIKEYIKLDTFVSSLDKDKNYANEEYLLCGRSQCDELRSIVKFDIETIKRLYSVRDNVVKIELCIYLSNLKVSNYMKYYMFNIGVNIDDWNINTISYCNKPRIVQECVIYPILKNTVNKYVNLDITHIIKRWLDKEQINNGITILGINTEGITTIESSRGVNKPYIKIYYNKDVEKTDDKQSENKECICKDNRGKVYGLFTNKTGKLSKSGETNIVPWECYYNVRGIRLSSDNFNIILNAGVYMVDYRLDIISDILTSSVLLLNGQPVVYSRIKIGGCECASESNIIIKVCDDNSKLQLIIERGNIILSNIGVCASIRIIKL